MDSSIVVIWLRRLSQIQYLVGFTEVPKLNPAHPGPSSLGVLSFQKRKSDLFNVMVEAVWSRNHAVDQGDSPGPV